MHPRTNEVADTQRSMNRSIEMESERKKKREKDEEQTMQQLNRIQSDSNFSV